jgi:hypothetical protein
MDIIYHDLCTQVTGAVHEDDAGEQAAESRNVAKGHGLYLIPAFASEHECDELTSVAAEYAARVAPPSCDEAHNTPPPGWRLGFAETPKQRLPVAKLAGAAQSLCDTLVRRTIALVESDGRLPALGELLFGSHDVRLADLDIRFSLNEPAVNIYGANGGFDEHEDGHQITILVPLSELDAFEGGGTSFWPTTSDAATFSLSEHDRSVHVVRDTSAAGQIMRPSRGTAMIFTGAVRRHHVAERIKPPPPCSHPAATLHPVFPICILRKMPDRGHGSRLSTVDCAGDTLRRDGDSRHESGLRGFVQPLAVGFCACGRAWPAADWEPSESAGRGAGRGSGRGAGGRGGEYTRLAGQAARQRLQCSSRGQHIRQFLELDGAVLGSQCPPILHI